jgi:uncharacterized membrane protein
MSNRTDSEPAPSTAAIAGHPLHPTLVPVPIGALTCALLSDIAFARTHDPAWAKASRFLLGTGLGSGALAAPLGLIDLLTIDKARRNPGAWLHGLGNVAAMGLTAVNLAGRGSDPGKGARVGLPLSVLTMGMLAVTGWLGGELSYRERIGVTVPRS